MFGESKYRMNDAYYEAKGQDPEVERAKRLPNATQDAEGDLYRVYTKIGVTVFVRDGVVTGVDPDQGWAEPSVSVEREGQDEIDLPLNSDEVDGVLAVLTGKWKVEQV